MNYLLKGMEEGDWFKHNHEVKKSFEDEEGVLEEILDQFAFCYDSPPTQNNSPFGFLNDNSAQLLTNTNNSDHINHSTVVPGARESRDLAGVSGTAHGTNHTSNKPRTSSASLDHIMAERKRRQQQSQRFIELSATIPGLNKNDKASILKEAITYIKHLQNRVKEKELEKQSPNIDIAESVSFIDRTDHDYYIDKGTTTFKTYSADCRGHNVALPVVKARVLENEVLIRIHCKNHKGVLPKILTHIKSLDLSIVSKNVLPIGKFALHITVIAKMDVKYNIIVKDLVKSLRGVLLDLPNA